MRDDGGIEMAKFVRSPSGERGPSLEEIDLSGARHTKIAFISSSIEVFFLELCRPSAYAMFNPSSHFLIASLGGIARIENCGADCHLLKKFDQSKIVLVVGV